MFTNALVGPEPGSPFTFQEINVDGNIRDDEILIEMKSNWCAGVVTIVGSKVTNTVPGDHVLLTYTCCKACTYCKNKNTSFFNDLTRDNFGFGRPDGSKSYSTSKEIPITIHIFSQSSFVKFAVMIANCVVKVDKSIPLQLLTPLRCGLMTRTREMLNLIRLTKDSIILITSAGAVRLASMMALKFISSPRKRVIAIDVVSECLILAKMYGATGFINSTKVLNLKDVLLAITGVKGVNGSIDTTGRPEIVRALSEATVKKRKVVSAGVAWHRSFNSHFRPVSFNDSCNLTMPPPSMWQVTSRISVPNLQLTNRNVTVTPRVFHCSIETRTLNFKIFRKRSPIFMSPRAEIMSKVPIIDFSPFLDLKSTPEAKEFTFQQIGHACRTSGFFYLSNHGVDQNLMNQMLHSARAFFETAKSEEKKNIAVKEAGDGTGDSARGYRRSDRSKRRAHEVVDFFRPIIDLDGPPYKIGLGENQWPTTPQDFREVSEKYIDSLLTLGHEVVRAIAMALDIEEEEFTSKINKPFWDLRIIGYEGTDSSKTREGKVGIGEHTDWGILTFLLTDQQKGSLQIRSQNGEWIPADPIPGCILVNLGDMLSKWTGGLYVSTKHRVLHSSPEMRISVPFFFDPNMDALIYPLLPKDGRDRNDEGIYYWDKFVKSVR